MVKNHQAGQMIVEMILILTLLFSFTVFIASQFRQQEFLSQFVQSPWARLAGMIQNGSWRAPDDSIVIHPNQPRRHAATRPEGQ